MFSVVVRPKSGIRFHRLDTSTLQLDGFGIISLFFYCIKDIIMTMLHGENTALLNRNQNKTMSIISGVLIFNNVDVNMDDQLLLLSSVCACLHMRAPEKDTVAVLQHHVNARAYSRGGEERRERKEGID
ncbi:Hypothetical predicted protein [Scomber scombrus]|uniref:Uncharacterized protein n=1 Tax=Scomber scombrus TaxID=13677 RepID=A0AAV1PZA1_SCOSC